MPQYIRREHRILEELSSTVCSAERRVKRTHRMMSSQNLICVTTCAKNIAQ